MKKIFVSVIVVVVIALFGIIFLTYTQPHNVNGSGIKTSETAESGSTSSQSGDGQSNKLSVFTGTITPDSQFTTGAFQTLQQNGNTNVGYIGYDSSKMLLEDTPRTQEGYNEAEYRKDYFKDFTKDFYNLSPVLDENGNPQKLYTGHTIYSDVDFEGKNGSIYYIMNGYDVLNLNAFRKIPDDEGYLLRKEGSSERIRLFSSQKELDDATQAWNAGQEILSNPSKEIQNGIILDGCLLNNAKWSIDEDGKVVVPLSTLGSDFSDGTYVTMTGVLHIPIFEGCGSPALEIPSKKTKNYDVENIAFGINPDAETWHYYASMDGGLWEADLPLANNNFSMDVLSASQLTGWTFSFDGTMLNIVTEPCNVTNNFMLRQ